jgi:outer membrane protein, multidrug efflux system
MNTFKQQKHVYFVVAMAIASLVGCKAVGPDYVRPQNILPDGFKEDNLNPAGESLSKQWWKQYQDATLNELIDHASVQNADIKVAIARVDQSEAYMRQVGASLYPEVSLGGSATRSRISKTGPTPLYNNIPANRSDHALGFTTSFELDFWGQLRRARESATAQALGTRFAKDTVDLSLKGIIANNYLLLRSLDAQIEVTLASVKTREESLKLTQAKFTGGVVSALDVRQAEAALSNLKAQIEELKRQRAISEHQLALLTGDLNLKIAPGSIGSIPIPPIPPAGLPSALLESRPDVRQAEQNLVAANANIGVAKSYLYPTVSLTGALGGESKDLGMLLSGASRTFSLGASFLLPIFTAGRLDAQVSQVTAQQKEALALYEKTLQQAFEEVNDALVNLRQSNEIENALSQSKDAAGQALNIALNRYQSGYTSYLDVLDAERVANDASIAFVQARQARLKASVDLFKALGGGWSS